MRVVFADTLYFLALINPQDQWRDEATNAESIVRESKVVTTEAVLLEMLNFAAGYGPNLRKALPSYATSYKTTKSMLLRTPANCS